VKLARLAVVDQVWPNPPIGGGLCDRVPMHIGSFRRGCRDSIINHRQTLSFFNSRLRFLLRTACQRLTVICPWHFQPAGGVRVLASRDLVPRKITSPIPPSLFSPPLGPQKVTLILVTEMETSLVSAATRFDPVSVNWPTSGRSCRHENCAHRRPPEDAGAPGR
jgi:hypothetical protein